MKFMVTGEDGSKAVVTIEPIGNEGENFTSKMLIEDLIDLRMSGIEVDEVKETNTTLQDLLGIKE